MCQFCDMLELKYSFYVNPKREHGFKLPIEKVRGNLIIASDFAITLDEMQYLVDNDVAVLSTDHHSTSDSLIDVKGIAEGIVINNQYPFEPEENRYQSGAGVFYELICSIYPEFESKEREALVGVTLLSDVRPIENERARKYLKTTYTYESDKGYINYLIKSTLTSDFGFGMPRLDRNFIDYTLSPRINALLRFNKTNEAINFILGEGLISSDLKTKQKELIEVMKSRAMILDLQSLCVIAVNELDFLDYDVDISSFIGLLCSNYKDSNSNKSTLGVVYSNGVITRASFRGKYDDLNYQKGFQSLGVDAQGHPPAFGIKDFNPTEATWKSLNKLIFDLEGSHVRTLKIVNSTNLAMTLMSNGMNMANENCYVRDMYRSYIKYTGKNIKVTRITYKYVEMSDEDKLAGVVPDKIEKGKEYRYLRDSNNNPTPKYIEYLIDGRKVKSFGVSISEGVILPILEKGYIQLYIRSTLD